MNLYYILISFIMPLIIKCIKKNNYIVNQNLKNKNILFFIFNIYQHGKGISFFENGNKKYEGDWLNDQPVIFYVHIYIDYKTSKSCVFILYLNIIITSFYN